MEKLKSTLASASTSFNNHRKIISLLSKLFTKEEGITVEQYFILQKVEKAKEWLVDNEHSLGDIAGQIGYGSVQHLSSQFKKN